MAKALPTAPFLAVGDAPHWHCGRTVQGVIRDMLIALIPAVIGALYWYGMEAARVMALSVVTAVVVEYLLTKGMNRKLLIDDMHAVFYGLLFAFVIPAGAPWWFVMAGSAVTMLMGKMLYGGRGGSPVCGPVVGWAFCKISWPLYMSADAMMLNSKLANPLAMLKYFGVERAADFSMMQLVSGEQLGALGATQVGALLLGGIFLIARGALRWQLPAGFIAGVLAFGGLMTVLEPATSVSPLFHLCTGTTMLAAFFLLPDFASSPAGLKPMLIYGIVAGAIVIIMRTYGIHEDGVLFAVLLANMVTPLVDDIKPKPFGAR